MNNIEELQSKATQAVKVIIVTGLVSMALFGAGSALLPERVSAEGVTSSPVHTSIRGFGELYANVDGNSAPQSVSGAVPDQSNGGDSRTIVGKQDIKASSVFSDMTDHWAEQQVGTAIAKGYVDGYPDGTFQPAKAVTRAEFIKLLVVATAGNQPDSGGEWYAQYVTTAKANKIVKDSDFPDGDYNKQMTRLELARASVRATGRDGTTNDEFLYLATSTGLMQGLDDSGALGADQITNRAQAVVIIERVLGILRGEKQEVSLAASANAELAQLRTNIFSKWPEFFNSKYSGVTQEKGYPVDRWKVDNLTIKGTVWGEPYEATLDELILVDWNDPADPNRYLLPDTTGFISVQTKQPITSDFQAYVLVSKVTVKQAKSGLGLPYVGFSGINGNGDLSRVPVGLLKWSEEDSLGNRTFQNYPYLFLPKNMTGFNSNGVYMAFQAPSVTGSAPLLKTILTTYPSLGK